MPKQELNPMKEIKRILAKHPSSDSYDFEQTINSLMQKGFKSDENWDVEILGDIFSILSFCVKEIMLGDDSI